VVEGVGDHGCEYMTSGTVVVLGETGLNFGAGMTGGQAYIYDIGDNFDRRYNTELIALQRLRGDEDERVLKQLITEHLEKTGSQRARTLLEDWETQRQLFWHVTPRENVVAIESATEGSGDVGIDPEKVAA